MFDYEYESPEAQRVRIAFEEIAAEYKADHKRLLSEDEQRAKELKELQAKHAQLEEEARKHIEAAEAAQQAEAPSPWTAPREQQESVISFGEFDDEHKQPAASWSSPTAPTPPMGFPPPPPIPEPVPEAEQIRSTVADPVMRFGEYDEEPVERPAPPPSGRRRLREDDDEDMSGQSWMS